MSKNTTAPADAVDLRRAIMDIPCCPYRNQPEFALGYKMGHRDARLAAADLASSAAETKLDATRNHHARPHRVAKRTARMGIHRP